MATYYVQSLFIFFGIFSLLGALVASLYFSRLDSSARYWVVAAWLAGVTNVATVFRDDLPLLWSYSIPIALSGTSFALMGLGIARLDNKGPQWRTLIGVSAGTLVFIVVMEWARLHAGPKITLLLSGGLLGLTSLWGAYFAHVYYRKSGNRFSLHMRWIMATLGLLHLMRTQGSITGWGVNTFGQEAWTYGIWTGAFVMGMLRYFAYVAIRMQAKNEESLQVATARAQEEAGRRLGAQLARLERQQSLGVMGASIAHELNQPLAVILNYAELLQRQQSPRDDPMTRVLDDIVASSVKAGDIVKRIRTSIEPAMLSLVRLDLRDAVKEVCDFVTPEILRDKIQLNLGSMPSPVWVKADPVQLSQVLLNVMRNAMESMAHSADRRIQLELVLDDKDACLSVQDTGRGLSDAAAEQAGDPFYTTQISGQGMGLSISKTILSQFGASLSLENTGQGACARIKMPLLDQA